MLFSSYTFLFQFLPATVLAFAANTAGGLLGGIFGAAFAGKPPNIWARRGRRSLL